MATELLHVSFEEFLGNPARFLELVIHNDQAVIVENNSGEGVLLNAVHSSEQRNGRHVSAAAHEAFVAAAGSWKDFDVDQFLRDVYESRDRPSRPPVEL